MIVIKSGALGLTVRKLEPGELGRRWMAKEEEEGGRWLYREWRSL